MRAETSSVATRAAITHLYETTGVALPGVRKCIVPLGELIGCFNLVCIEVPHLTQSRALQYLARQGGLVETAEAASSFMDDPLAGFLYVTPNYGCIFVEQEDLLVRRRFSVAHELGHYVLHFQPLLEQAQQEHEYLEIFEAQQSSEPAEDRPSEVKGRIEIAEEGQLRQRLPPYSQMEWEANQFAAELLMPLEIVQGLVARWMLLRGDDLARRLSTEMLVSDKSMHVRLQELGLLLGSFRASA